MATVIDLVSRGNLFRLDPQLDYPQQELRRIYTGPKLRKWIENDLSGLASDRVESSPKLQFDDLVALFCSGEQLTYDLHFKPLNHVEDGIWELKTTDLRIFGWFSQKDCFIGVIGDTKRRILDYGLYGPYAKMEVTPFRNQIDLDPPKYVPGKNPHDVVSDYD
ncbi:hypothetical protein [Bradyrhizobium sp. AUGA SZCCT0431]|uniref:hypothetical protein n=1 Tax=Bradyrhizobium sp. AUGA SZCCT0431 TaxID=2807674 RepID=UPI001BA6C6F9|nr:hypothetical protein [Bradyrhizobium sp. AUGA SZCCT0431]MBR1148368.1 hypothetical protein [Bradyrhizobium sp. AUGA SZCCT0431]